MNTAAIVVGVDSYEKAPRLCGAELDARQIFNVLVESGLYSSESVHLLLSPTLEDLRASIQEIFKHDAPAIFSFYFAGHGAEKAGTYYLCLRTSDPDRLATTALAIQELLTVIAEAQPRQANIVIDACHSAGAMYDLHAVLKPDAIGAAATTSLAFLAASATDQYAQESSAGGLCTTSLLRYLRGDQLLQSKSKYLDLIEIGKAVSNEIRGRTNEQVPVTWGLNLYGDGVFARNPHHSETGEWAYSTPTLSPTSSSGKASAAHAEALWKEYLGLPGTENFSSLRDTLHEIRTEVGDDYCAVLSGIVTSFAARAQNSTDDLQESDLLATCAVTLMGLAGSSEKGTGICRAILERKRNVDRKTCSALVDRIQRDEFALLSPNNPLADLHYLPLRVSRLLAWAALSALAESTLAPDETGAREKFIELSRLILSDYRDALIAVADDQAPWLYLFSEVATRNNAGHLAAEVAERYFASLLPFGGRVLVTHANGQAAFRHTAYRASVGVEARLKETANPSELLAVLLTCCNQHHLQESWDLQLHRLDGTTAGIFVPATYHDFYHRQIGTGKNILLRLGHGIWSVNHFVTAFEANVSPLVDAASTDLGDLDAVLASYAAYLFPDRVPYLLGAVHRT